MSDDGGGDSGSSKGGGDKGGSGKGNSSNGGVASSPTGEFPSVAASAPSSSSALSIAPTDTPTSTSGNGTLDDWINNPTGNSGSGDSSNSGWLDSASLPGGDNLSGPGPVGGDSGLPGAGGGTNTPLALGGVDTTSTGTPNWGALAATPNADALLASNPGTTSGPSAESVSAPQGVSGLPDLATAEQGAVADATKNKTASTTSGSTSGSTSGGGSDLLKSLGIGSNPLGTVLAGGGLLNSLINGSKDSAAIKALQGQATQANANAQDIINTGKTQNANGQPDVAQGQQMILKGADLQNYITTGKLPQGYEDQLQQAAQAAKTQIISRYAANGQPTDPTQNSVLAQELGQIDARLPAMREQIASGLATSGNSIVGAGNQTISTGGAEGTDLIGKGLSAAGVSSSIFAQLANLDNDKAKQQSAAIANFAAALNNTPKSINLTLPGAKAA